MVSNYITLGSLVLILAVAVLFLLAWKRIGRNKTQPQPGATQEVLSSSEICRVFGCSSLIEYSPTHSYEEVTVWAVSAFLNAGKDVVLLTQAPRSNIYYERFKSFVKKGALNIVNITTENPLAKPQMFRITPSRGESDIKKEETGITPVSINNLEFLTEIAEQMKEGSVLVFEALTGLILALGTEKKEAVYKFFSTIVEEMSGDGRILVAFLNNDAHEKEIISAYEGLFVRIFKIENGCLVSHKGGKERLLIESFRVK